MPGLFGKEPLTPKGRWVVVAAATGLLQVSYWPVVAGVMLVDRADPAVDAALVLGLSAVPFVFMVLAFGSRHPRAPSAVLRAMGLFVLVALPLGLVHVALGLTAGYAAGGIASLRPGENVGTHRPRVIAVVATTTAVALVTAAALEAGLVLGAVLPFVALGIVDRRAESQGRRAR